MSKILKTATRLAIAAAITAGALTGTAARADGIISFDIGKEHYCIGLWSCLFKPKTFGDRDPSNTMDHRNKTTDHRPERKNTVVNVIGNTRDHRGETKIRDHRPKNRLSDRGGKSEAVSLNSTKGRDLVRVRDHRN